VAIGNYYLHNIFDETKLTNWGVMSSAGLLAIMFLLAFLLL
jgi:hypothetical protein